MLGTFGAELFRGTGQSSDDGKKYYKVVDGVLQRTSRSDEKDPGVIPAIARARATFPEFVQALRRRHPAHPYFSVRRPYATPDGGREHLWIEDVREIAGGFEGTLAVEPDDTRLVTPGQRPRFTVQEISDWLYLEDDRLVGGYTIRYVTDRMTPEDKRRFEQESGFRVP